MYSFHLNFTASNSVLHSLFPPLLLQQSFLSHHFVYRLLLIIVHTKARVRRYQQLNPSSISYPVHLSSLVRTLPCHPSHTSSMSSYSPPSPHHPPPPNVGTQKPNHRPLYVPHAQTISACHD